MMQSRHLLQIYTGYMERKFVPVEERGKGQTDANVDAPVQLRNDNPHTEHTENGSGHGMTACSNSMSLVTSGHMHA